ncbi:small multidrug resistance protein [Segniliparus rotundus DSM 44985]|uniref:Multidrug resistance protein Mmr n=1 Tax=Segniliparus rotundus (strain ATCC BAA-972 / CDC 1076 / CIP 108378 / DSM 44985 / JCM 13578) TaxID=640132 RepID=D6ZFM4_SEGRD|nr:multidrug efflux SMR transporter [Segniliparus rotundus]ADG97748.1 small multidrug resistance protein [Segniliparus rotundus DSM 44985]
MVNANWVCLAVAILCEVVATASLKQVDGLRYPLPLVLVVVGYTAAFFFLSLTLKQIPVGVAYAIWSAAGTVLITMVAWLWYRQHLSALTVVGLGVTVVGVVLVNLGSSGAH